jgi:hypothetical protein
MATRFYLPYSGAAPVTPDYDVNWGDTSIAARLPLPTSKTSTTITTITFPQDADDTEKDILFRQYISEPIAAQTITAQTVEFQIRAAEFHALNNLYTTISIRVVSNDGSSVTGTILALTRDATEVTTVLTNRRFTATTSQVIANANDRIVIEIGMGGDPGPNKDHGSTMSIGDNNATDLPEDDTTTDAFNPWVEFPTTITGLEAVSSHTYFKLPISSGNNFSTKWIWNSGQFNVTSGLCAMSSNPSKWKWYVVSSSANYFYPSSIGDPPTKWKWVSGNQGGAGK